MKAHRTDLVSFAFGLVFLALSVWWLLAQLLGLALPPVGWFLAGALILIGVLGLVGALRSGRTGSGRQPAPPVGDRLRLVRSDSSGRQPAMRTSDRGRPRAAPPRRRPTVTDRPAREAPTVDRPAGRTRRGERAAYRRATRLTGVSCARPSGTRPMLAGGDLASAGRSRRDRPAPDAVSRSPESAARPVCYPARSPPDMTQSPAVRTAGRSGPVRIGERAARTLVAELARHNDPKAALLVGADAGVAGAGRGDRRAAARRHGSPSCRPSRPAPRALREHVDRAGPLGRRPGHAWSRRSPRPTPADVVIVAEPLTGTAERPAATLDGLAKYLADGRRAERRRRRRARPDRGRGRRAGPAGRAVRRRQRPGAAQHARRCGCTGCASPRPTPRWPTGWPRRTGRPACR